MKSIESIRHEIERRCLTLDKAAPSYLTLAEAQLLIYEIDSLRAQVNERYAYDGRDTGSNTAENWPAPCHKCCGGR